jgi:hypothetical protein
MPYAKTSLRAEQRALREKMRELGMSHRQIAVEFARRYRRCTRSPSTSVLRDDAIVPAGAVGLPSPFLDGRHGCPGLRGEAAGLGLSSTR